MRLKGVSLVLLLGKACGAVIEATSVTADLRTTVENDHVIGPLKNHGGWVNPEDIMAMPQCVAQQDQAAWLSIFTKCTSKICINHFGPRICTRHQWLTQLSCLSMGFSPDVVNNYILHCSRSILAKAQLSSWIQNITGRTWLVNVGDTIDLQHLSSASLANGYAAIGITHKAPTCLTKSTLGQSREPFAHAIASCSFADSSDHTGNSARPWEYRESLRSMIALDSVTVGYDLTGQHIPVGDYFDKACFCDSLEGENSQNTCSGYGLSLTMGRLWINATCGSSSLPGNWTQGLRTTEFDYIPVKQWRWPKCFTDMPDQVTGSVDLCTTDACEVDTDGYCNVKRAVDRSCFCSNISYETCGRSCHVFESRIDYIQWLHSTCGEVRGWHGLPQDWRRLAAPTTTDFIPFPWMISDGVIIGTSVPFMFKLVCLGLLNATPFLAIIVSTKLSRRTSTSEKHVEQFLAGASIVAFNILTTVLSAFIGTQIFSIDDTPAYQLMLLWSTLPRLTWLASLLVITKRQEVEVQAISATLATEWVFQAFVSYTMLQAVQYGFEHNFYEGAMEKLNTSILARFMYAGALLWIATAIIALLFLIQAIFEPVTSTCTELPETHNTKSSKTNSEMKTWSIFEQHVYDFLTKEHHTLEEERLINNLSAAYGTTYGTLPASVPLPPPFKPIPVRLYSISIASLLLLWVAQWLFWVGLLGLTSGY